MMMAMAAILDLLIGTISAIFDLQVTLMLPTKIQNWLFDSGEEAENRFSRWRQCLPSWISNLNDFRYFLSTSHPNASYQVSSQLAYQFRRIGEKQILKIYDHQSEQS